MYTTTLSKSSVTTRVRRDIELLESMWLFIQEVVGNQSYIIGQCKLSQPLNNLLHQAMQGILNVFLRLLKNGILYHSSTYKKLFSGKRDNSHCCYQSLSGDICYGRIELFSNTPSPCVLIRQLQQNSTSLLEKAGHPCRSVLVEYQGADLLSSYIVPVNMSTVDHSSLTAVSIDSIISKVCVIVVGDSHYCIVQPNNIERH